jgi:hypothetical protein
MIQPGDVITYPASWPIRVRIKSVKPDTELRDRIMSALHSYSGPHVCRKLFKSAALAMETECDPLTKQTIRAQLLGMDKRRDAKTLRLATQAAKMMGAGK